ncbi:aspartate aminotransferase, cytoplasmic-like [Bacillus rossius redtenbacheri]|uniref:aspartate aminotransferase, cytoplasmic-like n=1 Tax=Bacillus rossius redtenbacheri TaxID=93214 RepID=UPI002FDDFA36
MAGRFQGNGSSASLTELSELRRRYASDDSDQKVELLMGAYRHDDGLPWVPPAVRLAEQQLQEDAPSDHQYMPFLGDKEFRLLASRVVLGQNSPALLEGRVVCAQTLGGTGALSMGARFLHQVLNCRTIYFSSPTWQIHESVFTAAGFRDVRHYRYWSASGLSLDFRGMMEDLEAAPRDSAVLLQACAHNPTGMDLSRDQWRRVADLVQEKKLLPFMDCAYQGFASGDLDNDVWPVRYFVERGIEFLCAQSFSKNMGLYDERLGCLLVVASHAASCPHVVFHLEQIELAAYLTVPRHGSRTAARILRDAELCQQWKRDIAAMSGRVRRMREELRRGLEEVGAPGSWSHITDQIGMFSYTGLSPEAVKHMVNDYHVYMLSSGRMNMCGVTSHNVSYIATAIRNSILRATSGDAKHLNGLSASNKKLQNGTSAGDAKHLNGMSPGDAKHLNGMSTGDAKHLNGMSTGDAKHLNGMSTGDAKHLNGMSTGDAKHLNGMSTGDAKHLNGMSTGDAKHLNGMSTGDAKHLNGMSTGDAKHLNGMSTGDAKHLNGMSTGDAKHLNGMSTGDAKHLNGMSTGDAKHLNGTFMSIPSTTEIQQNGTSLGVAKNNVNYIFNKLPNGVYIP